MKPTSPSAVVSLAKRRAAKGDRARLAGLADTLEHQGWLKLLLSRPEMTDMTSPEGQRAGPWDTARGLDEAGHCPAVETRHSSLGKLERLAPQLMEELERITAPFSDHAPSDAELRLAQAQLTSWLERLSRGIQTELFAQQMAAQQQLQSMVDVAAAAARYQAASARPGPARNHE